MTDLEFMRISRETQAHADDNPVLLALWRDFTRDHEPSLQEFTNHLERYVGGVMLWQVVDTDESYQDFMERRLEDE